MSMLHASLTLPKLTHAPKHRPGHFFLARRLAGIANNAMERRPTGSCDGIETDPASHLTLSEVGPREG
jgi:hypothetical protein